MVAPRKRSVTAPQAPLQPSQPPCHDLQVCHVSCHRQQDELHCLIALPGCSATLRPIYSKRVCNLPLAQTLAEDLRQRRQQAQVVPAQSGLLSMDQARSLLPLLADDPTVRRDGLRSSQGSARAKATLQQWHTACLSA